MRPLTLDASVFISATRADEPRYAESRALLQALSEGQRPLVEPTLLLVELGGAISRGAGAEAAARVVAQVRNLRNSVLISLDDGLAMQAAAVAAELRLRGADAVYAAVAQRFGTILVTVDKEQRTRCRGVVAAVWPAQALLA